MSEARDYGEPASRIMREEYHAWTQRRRGRFERINSIVVAMAPERASHNRARGNLREMMRTAIRQAALSDRMA